MSTWMAYWQQMLEPGAASLPEPLLLQGWLRWGWGLVLAALTAGAARWVQRRWRVRAPVPLLAALALLWCAWGGPASPAYWLGLAFQAPSLSLGAVAVLCLLRLGAVPGRAVEWGSASLGQLRAWALPAVLLGWVLLLDSFAVWPVALYPLGFGIGVWWLLLAAGSLPWAWQGGPARQHLGVVLCCLVLLAFALLRLPSGNAWDALLDPWLWLLAHAVLARAAWCRYEKRSC